MYSFESNHKWIDLIVPGNFELIHRVQLLQDALGKAILISKEATQRIEEFQIQLSILQRQCSSRDRPLCDTLRLRSFEDNGILNILTRVKEWRFVFFQFQQTQPI